PVAGLQAIEPLSRRTLVEIRPVDIPRESGELMNPPVIVIGPEHPAPAGGFDRNGAVPARCSALPLVRDGARGISGVRQRPDAPAVDLGFPVPLAPRVFLEPGAAIGVAPVDRDFLERQGRAGPAVRPIAIAGDPQVFPDIIDRHRYGGPALHGIFAESIA